jgi:hypothetical protein
MNDRYPCYLAIISVFLAEHIASVEKDDSRRAKMGRVIHEKRRYVEETCPSIVGGRGTDFDAAEVSSDQGITEEMARDLIIDSMFSDPVAPYSLKYDRNTIKDGLRKIAEALGITVDRVDQLYLFRGDAESAYQHVSRRNIAMWSVAGLVILAPGGWVAAPFVGMMIGSAAGLYGAATTAYGLALLGGGSLAAGGLGMAGGMWAVTGVVGITGAVTLGATKLMLELTPAQVLDELVKVQIRFAELMNGDPEEMAKAKPIVEELVKRNVELQVALEAALEWNDPGSDTVKDIESKIEAIEDCRQWMRSELEK